ncbi:hypothetical protein R302_22080 [Salmonella enterica]|uniref:HTH luxR-type domain-containing protein n=1 Tax=Salmonella enterica TaxID=28901 RepID=A0A633Q289_SALER|nr:hypothetical protein [Salmonella enterica]EBD1260537.1 hypothetical protein [Salmonella enterica subsp. arizonae serovar 62:z4,z32:-]EDC6052521.1 hypothetical protein [Salmonella enterica]EDH3028821.1 hypothetical protein [Salmonella enterica]EGP1492446.1 hypothetical protein [Salmonella enterica]
MSCLLVGSRERWGDPAGGYDWLPSRDVRSARETLLRVLEWPEHADPVRLMMPLSPRQQAILEGTLAKKTVSQIARELGVTARAVFASRQALMTKMGLGVDETGGVGCLKLCGWAL